MGLKNGFKRSFRYERDNISQKGGRLTLLYSTLASLPIYFMSLFTMPRIFRFRLEKIQRDFLWGGGALLENKMHLVKWSSVCKVKCT